MTMGTHPDRSPAADSIAQLAINTIRTLSMDAVHRGDRSLPSTSPTRLRTGILRQRLQSKSGYPARPLSHSTDLRRSAMA